MTPATTQAVLKLVPSDEERQIRAAVRGICDGFPEDYARQKYAAGEPPTELWDALAEKGYLGVNLPEEWGGGGLGMSGLATVGEEIAAAGKSLLLIVVSPAIVGNILARHGTDEQKERWLRGIAAGTTKIAFAITEPDAGTNSHNLSTSVERRGDKLVLRGQKTYISGVEHADAVLVVARSRMADGSLGLPSLAIVDVDAPGFTRDQIPMPYLGPGQAVDALLRRRRAGGGAADRRRGRRPRPGVRRPQPRAHHGRLDRLRGGHACTRQGGGLRERAGRLGRPDRHASGHRAPARGGEDRARAGPPDDAEGLRALRRRRARRGRGEQHGEVRGGRGGHQVRGPGDPGARRQRLRARVRALATCGGACVSPGPRPFRAR